MRPKMYSWQSVGAGAPSGQINPDKIRGSRQTTSSRGPGRRYTAQHGQGYWAPARPSTQQGSL